MQATLETRLLDLDSDTRDLIELYEMVFGHTVTPWMWAWKYRPPWAERHYCWIGASEGSVIGYIGAVPLRGVVGGREVPFFQLADMMVHPRHRMKHDYFGLATRTMLEDFDEHHPDRLLYGFSNHRAFLMLRRSGLTGLVERAGVRHLVPAAAGSGFQFTTWDWSEPQVDRLWEELGAGIEVGLVRDGQYLGWRYAAHPVNSYRLIGIQRDGRPVGWAVVAAEGLLKPGIRKRIPIVDVLLPDEALSPALRDLATHLGQPLAVWLPKSRAPELSRDAESGTHVYHFVKNSVVDTAHLQAHLYYTMGDVDWW